MSDATPTAGGQGAVANTGAVLGADPAAPSSPATPTSAQVTATPAAPAAAAPDWLKGADDLTIGYVQNKGWTDPKQVLQGYQNLEKLLGADKAGNALVVPKADADPKEWAAVFDRLGRPTGPDGYKVDVPQGGDAKLQSEMLAKAHELGLTKAQAEGLFGEFNNRSVAAMQAAQAAKQEAFQREDADIKREWGSAYAQELAKAQQAARGLGLDSSTIDKLSDALGHAGTMKLLNQIGSRLGEDKFVTGDRQAPFGSAMTPAQAQAEIRSLSQDKGFITKLIGKDAESLSKWTKLHEFAYPDGQ